MDGSQLGKGGAGKMCSSWSLGRAGSSSPNVIWGSVKLGEWQVTAAAAAAAVPMHECGQRPQQTAPPRLPYSARPPASAAAGGMLRLALDPMATPPASVAFWMWTMSSLSPAAAEAAKAARQAPNSASTVFMTQKAWGEVPLAAVGAEARAPLKLGQ